MASKRGARVCAIAMAAKTPRAIVARLNAEFGRILSAPEVRETLLRQGLEPAPGTPEAFGAYMKSEHAKWAKVIADASLTAN